LVNLDKWVKDGAPPPNNRLMPLESRANATTILQAPSYLPNATILVAKRDQDGNPLGGVRLPDLEAPLGVYGGQNAPLKSVICMLASSYVPFAKTKAEREASRDHRSSIEERYAGGLNEYLNKIRLSANRLVEQKFLLEDDAAVIVNSAAESPLFKPTSVPPIFR
jgi:Alpha/beta hydrolase domain